MKDLTEPHTELYPLSDLESLCINGKISHYEMMSQTRIHLGESVIDEIIPNEVEKYVLTLPKPYKKHFIEPDSMDDISDKIANLIKQGNNLNVSCILAGYNYNVLRTRFSQDNKEKFKLARQIKYSINK